MFSVAFMYSIIWVFIVKRQTWNGKTVEEEGCSHCGLKSYCPIVMGIRKGEILINGEQIYRQTVKKIIISILHHRFNVAFHLRGALYFHKEYIIPFLKSIEYDNILISSVK